MGNYLIQVQALRSKRYLNGHTIMGVTKENALKSGRALYPKRKIRVVNLMR